ncbi:hypothetical protein GG344DRAFT_80398 [Lentinula edodes]|nr:hypothetical protein GG344DRAFT_80398 [Lentinula edodes]
MSKTTTASGFGFTATDKNTPQSFVSLTTTQPLILVFLAIGLFSAVSIAILAWRRANNLRVERAREEERRRRRRYTGVDGGQFGIDGITTEEATSMGLFNGETPPRLWDLRRKRERAEAVKGVSEVLRFTWEGIMRNFPVGYIISSFIYGKKPITMCPIAQDSNVEDKTVEIQQESTLAVVSPALFRSQSLSILDRITVLLPHFEQYCHFRRHVQQQISGGLSPPQEHEENTMLMMTLARNYTDGMEEVRTFQKKNHLEDHVKHGRKTHAFQIAVAIALPRRHVANGGPRRYGYEPDVPGKYRLV